MKKLLIMVLLLCSLCAVCFAKVERPADDRWVIAGGGKESEEIWVDVDSVNFANSKEIGHGHHQAAQIWFMGTNYETDMQLLILTEFDFECRTMRRVSMSTYDGSGEFLGTFPGDAVSDPVIPGTVGEEVFSMLLDMKDLRSNQGEYDLYLLFLKSYTESYKEGEAV